VNQLEPRSLRDRAYDEIKRRIITLEFKPGAYLNEALISDELAIGRTPVHQALDRLMIEGMVEVIPRKGVLVRNVSLEEVRNLIEVRLINEPHAAALAAEKATDDQLGHLQHLLDMSDDARAARNIETLMNLDRAFHQGIARAAGNEVLTDVITTLQDRLARFWFISLSADDQLDRVDDEHGRVMEGLYSRDPAVARAAMHHHIDSFRANIMATL
jgi:DNA-binding GntR family transcriptional regulator